MNSSTSKLAERHQKFYELHQSGCFIIPNPWDVGSAKIMAAHGAKALATTSGGFAATLGRKDLGTISRDEALAHAESFVRNTNLPVSGDFENGFADSPEDVAETIRLAGEAGLSGCSIEDTQISKDNASYDLEYAVDRIAACVEAKNKLSHPFILCARADGILQGNYDINEAVKRIKAFEKAGADLVYAPLVTKAEEIKMLLEAVNIPLNVLVFGSKNQCSYSELAEMGVRRISIGGAATNVVLQSVLDVCDSILNNQDFSILNNQADGKKIDSLFAKSDSMMT